MPSSWRDELKSWIYANHKTVADFARTINVPRETVQTWINPGRASNPGPMYRRLIFKVTGIKVPKAPPKRYGKRKTKISPESHINNLALLIRATSRMTIDFLLNSSPADRTELRKLLGDDLEEFLEASRGLYSEKSLSQVVGERLKRTPSREDH
jgi:hypothetical protein